MKFPVQVITSGDPNDKSGSLGAGPRRYVSGSSPLRYAIFFSNEQTANAPAADIVITDQLDPMKVDISTVTFGSMSFGSTLLTPPPGATNYANSVDLRPGNSLAVRVNARVDQSTGLITWTLNSIDPLTNRPPTKLAAGFLPPGAEGSVFFTVMPIAGITTDSAIRNQAKIVFDFNTAMSTQTWLNTIDSTPPKSQIATLSATESSTTFTVQWSGTDLGSGIKDFTIYVSDNGGPFTAFLTQTTATSAVFAGQIGHTYHRRILAPYAARQSEHGHANLKKDK